MTNLFQTIANGNRGLNKTAELTALAEKISSEIFSKIGNSLDVTEKELTNLKAELAAAADADKEMLQAQIDDKTAALDKLYADVEASKESHDAMDKLIADSYDIQAVDISFLQVEPLAEDADDAAKVAYEAKVAENDATVDKMIKSQQSKRSRAKSKTMTQDNYNTLMVGAISENLLRIASGKEKTGAGHRGNSKAVEYDEATIEIYKTDKDKLSKEIRNIQSKKSIMKSKANFDEKSDAYQTLLNAEAMLKGLRGDAAAATVVKTVVPEYVAPLVTVKQFVDTEFATKDISKIKLNDAKEMLTEIIAMMAAIEVPAAESTEEPEAAADKDAE